MTCFPGILTSDPSIHLAARLHPPAFVHSSDYLSDPVGCWIRSAATSACAHLADRCSAGYVPFESCRGIHRPGPSHVLHDLQPKYQKKGQQDTRPSSVCSTPRFPLFLPNVALSKLVKMAWSHNALFLILTQRGQGHADLCNAQKRTSWSFSCCSLIGDTLARPFPLFFSSFFSLS